MKRLAILALLCLAPLAGAQSVKLPAQVSGDPGVIVVVKADTDCAGLKWVCLDPGLSMIPVELLQNSRTAVVMAGKAGSYRLLAYGAKGDAASEPAVCVVVLGPPAPPPVPTPTPPVPPAPAAAKVWAILVADEAAPTVELGKLKVAKVWGDLAAKGHRWHFYDVNSQEAKAKQYVAPATKAGLPALLILDQQSTPPGKLLKAVPVKTADDVAAAVKGVTG